MQVKGLAECLHFPDDDYYFHFISRFLSVYLRIESIWDIPRWLADTSVWVTNIINNTGMAWDEGCASRPRLVKPWLCLSLWYCLWPKLISEFKFYLMESIQLCKREISLCAIYWCSGVLPVYKFALSHKKTKVVEVLSSHSDLLSSPLSFPCWKALYQRSHKNLHQQWVTQRFRASRQTA